jgi:hypothetical protein
VYSYIAYGLGIHSALPLPELVAGEGAADVVVRLGAVEHMPSELDSEGGRFWATAEEACRVLPKVGTFLVRGGREVIVEPAPGVEDRVLRLSLLGPVLAILLHQRGRFVLHASAVESAGGAVVFTGGSGWGKSTLAAALHARGCGLVADDVTAIAVGTNGSTVLPGFPQLKLWPEAVVSLGEAPETMPRLHPLLDKRARLAIRGFSHRVLPLKRIYLLAEGSVPGIEPLRPQEALIELVRHWYGSRFGDRLLQAGGAAVPHFLQCAALVNRVAVHRLRRPRPVRALLDVARLVEDHLAHA